MMNTYNSSEKKAFFLFGCARSGTTSLCRILDLASNACCLLEPSPQMHQECRMYWNGEIGREHVMNVLRSVICTRAEKIWNKGLIYGEKNIPLGIFPQLLAQVVPSKFMYITRDGRDCVNSIKFWHTRMFGNFYREAKKSPDLSQRAQNVIDRIPVSEDLSDYGRPRPLPGDPWYERWSELTHHEMLCWYWNAWNMRILDELEALPSDQWLRIDYSSAHLPDQIFRAIQFLGLQGITGRDVSRLLMQHVNSIPDRTGEPASPSWKNWTDEELDQFWEICRPAMSRLGYFVPSGPEERRWTETYGSWWNDDTPDDFFESFYEDRIYQHTAFFTWATPLRDSGKISSVLDVCSGHSLGYADFFKDDVYTGIDISPKEIRWCTDRYTYPAHEWICTDFIRNRLDRTFDLVICQGSIENVYDMDMLIMNMAACSKKYIYIAGYYGFHDDIVQHKYIWDERYKCYENVFSLKRAQIILQKCRFTIIRCEKIVTHKQNNPYESLIIAERTV